MSDIQRKKLRPDIIVIALVIVIGAFLGLFMLLTAKQGVTVQVRVSGEITAEYPLEQELECDIKGKDGGINHLVIRKGEAWVDHADCPDGLCVNMGKIHISGQSIICLPNQVVVEIVEAESDKDSPAIDSVVGK